ncbi:MAG: hypothetical protein HYZ33_01985, partial [Ignavibacteriales bacterium]|nr:hypothetical protein [Ignavibacteriales bacterium]
MKFYLQAKLLRILCNIVGLTALLVFDFTDVHAGFERRDVGARQRAIGGAFVGLTDDVWAIHYNPAGLSNVKQSQVSVFYSPQTFGLSELSNGAVVGMVPTELGNFGLGIQHFGYELYRELSYTLGYS